MTRAPAARATPQAGILRAPPAAGRFVTFALGDGADAGSALRSLAAAPHDGRTILGIGAPLILRAGGDLAALGLRGFPADLHLFPATQGDLWAFVGHADRSGVFDAGRALAKRLGGDFSIVDEVDAFTYRGGRDLSGFEDGTENPQGKAATAAAIVRDRGPGLDGGSFVAVQRWVHDLDAMATMPPAARDHVIGRRLKGNRELVDAPRSAHVKRAAQEDFDPPAFILRRSMPWGGIGENGLVFVAYGESLDRYERILRRMAGRDDGIVDAITSFSRAMTGGYYFCPPVAGGRLDLRAVLPATR